jgi:hypothetical protein
MLAPRKKLWSTPLEVVDRAIDLLEINSSDTVVDIGAGDGRFMVRCVERTEASKVIGVEIDEERGNEAAAKIADAGLEDRCDLIIGNALDQDYAASGGTAFFLYLIPRGLRIVLPILQAIPRRIRVVTYISPFPDEVKPVSIIRVKSVAHGDSGVEWPLYLYVLNDDISDEKGNVSDSVFTSVVTQKEETNEEFIARKEAEAAVEFADAVNEWRKEKAAGRGDAKIIESGGDFGDVIDDEPIEKETATNS